MACCLIAPSHYLKQYWHLIIAIWGIHLRAISQCAPKLLFCIMSLKTFLNSLRPKWNRRHFADDIFKCIFLNENVWIPIKFSLKFVPKGPINNISALVQITVWRRPGDKPLSEPMMVSLLTHICVTRPPWVKPTAIFPRGHSYKSACTAKPVK